ncbi:hypothetical protein D3C76_1752330 [compost metagenome]
MGCAVFRDAGHDPCGFGQVLHLREHQCIPVDAGDFVDHFKQRAAYLVAECRAKHGLDVSQPRAIAPVHAPQNREKIRRRRVGAQGVCLLAVLR